MKKGQTWSIELSITMVIFLVALVIFASLILKKDNQVGNLSSDAEKTMTALSNSNEDIIKNNQLDKDKISKLNYTELKQELSLKNPVCIYFEDRSGRIINISGKTAFGDSIISINGQTCANNS